MHDILFFLQWDQLTDKEKREMTIMLGMKFLNNSPPAPDNVVDEMQYIKKDDEPSESKVPLQCQNLVFMIFSNL